MTGSRRDFLRALALGSGAVLIGRGWYKKGRGLIRPVYGDAVYTACPGPGAPINLHWENIELYRPLQGDVRAWRDGKLDPTLDFTDLHPGVLRVLGDPHINPEFKGLYIQTFRQPQADGSWRYCAPGAWGSQ